MVNFHNNSSLLRWEGNQRRIGITGGIATGKSAVGNYLKKEKKIPILDADKYAREALGAKQEITRIVINKYGNEILLNQKDKNEIDRRKLGKIIFSSQKERKWLEELVLPKVNEKIKLNLVKYNTFKVIGIIIPLLFEHKYESLCSEIWLVTCQRDQQYQRLMKRDFLTKSDADLRINSQFDLPSKEKLADIIIDNSGEKNCWIKQVDSLISKTH